MWFWREKMVGGYGFEVGGEFTRAGSLAVEGQESE